MTTRPEIRPRDDSGMTLIEVLAAMLIVSFVLAGMAAAGISGLVSVRSEKDKLTSNQLTSEIVENLRSAPFASVAPADPATSLNYPVAARSIRGATYTPTVVSEWMDDPCNGTNAVPPPAVTPPAVPGPHAARDFLRFTVTLNWTDGKGRARQVVTQTYRTPTFNERRPATVDALSASC